MEDFPLLRLKKEAAGMLLILPVIHSQLLNTREISCRMLLCVFGRYYQNKLAHHDFVHTDRLDCFFAWYSVEYLRLYIGDNLTNIDCQMIQFWGLKDTIGKLYEPFVIFLFQFLDRIKFVSM